jgi:hypothetical protein
VIAVPCQVKAMADATGPVASPGAAAAAAPPPLLRRSARAKAKMSYPAEAARTDSPPKKRAKRAAPQHAAADADDGAAELADVAPGARITLARATSEEFCLNKAQLEAARLRYNEAPNPHAKRSGAPMRLYDQREVLSLALRLHGGRAGLEAVRAKRSARRAACLLYTSPSPRD